MYMGCQVQGLQRAKCLVTVMLITRASPEFETKPQNFMKFFDVDDFTFTF